MANSIRVPIVPWAQPNIYQVLPTKYHR